MANIEVSIDSEGDDVVIHGGVYARPVQSDDQEPIGPVVFIKRGYSGCWKLPPGRYAFIFHLETGCPRCTVSIADITNKNRKQALAKEDFDLSVMRQGRVLTFNVGEAG